MSHVISSIRNKTDASAMVYDEEIVENLRAQEGEYIELKISTKGMEWKEINEADIQETKNNRPEIKIPEIIPTDRLLRSDEYEPELVGAKAYNLRRLEEMAKHGKLQDVIIPKSFAIPCGVFDKVLEANPEISEKIAEKTNQINQSSNFSFIYESLKGLRNIIYDYYGIKNNSENLEIPEEIKQEILDFKDECNLGEKVMVRSSFNGEDAKGYSAAGLYDSNLYYDGAFWFNSLTDAVKAVWVSKWNDRAYWSRRENNIAHDIIKPAVIIQDYANVDYRFTIYTKDPENNNNNEVLIEMDAKTTTDPYIIKYDKQRKEVSLEAIGVQKERKILFDEDLNIIYSDPVNDPIINNLAKWKPLLKKVCEAAVNIEEEFVAPQDIEGGITLGEDKDTDDAQIYIWQTRDIV